MIDPKHQIDPTKIKIPSVKSRRTLPSFDKCNVASCKDMARSRGVCGLHYYHARLLIKEGVMTEETAVKLGILSLRKTRPCTLSPHRKDLLDIINRTK